MDYGSRAEVRFDQIRLQTSGSLGPVLSPWVLRASGVSGFRV